MRPVHTATLRGRRFELVEGDIDGYCDYPAGTRSLNSNNRVGTIFVREGLSEKDRLETLIHESLHACYPRLSEKQVTEGGRDIARLLWRLGYRRGH